MGLVLLVEDDEDIRDALADALTAAGYRVAMASNGHHALEWLRASDEPPSLALVDMHMPVMDGRELVAHLRGGDYSALPVVMLSAVPARELDIAGVTATVQKPVTRDALLDVIGKTLGAI